MKLRVRAPAVWLCTDDVPVRCPVNDKIVISNRTSLMAVKIRVGLDNVEKYLTDSVPHQSVSTDFPR